jgi:hypothetical protein
VPGQVRKRRHTVPCSTMSATKSGAIAIIWAASLLVASLILPCRAQCEFTSPLDVDGPTEVEADQLLKDHPSCGPLILYSIMASEHPELLLANLDRALQIADALATDARKYNDMMEAFTVIALHLSEHRDVSQVETVEYWRRACDKMERCSKETVPGPVCNTARSAIHNFDF